MKNKLVSTIILVSLALQLVACGASNKNNEAQTAESSIVVEQEVNESNSESVSETGLANPWRECTEDEAKAACPRLFKLPEDGLVSSWSIMDPDSTENGIPGQLVQLDFRMDGMDFTARAKYGASENEDISGINYDFDVSDDITLANWGEGNMQGKLSRHIEDDWMIDLCTWYDIEIGIAYSLSVEAENLEGFDLQTIAEQMYNAENEPLNDEPNYEESETERQTQSFEGQYYVGRGNLSITGQSDGRYLIEVWWGSSASEHSEWVMYGEYDESTQTITYSDCIKHDYVLDDHAEIESDEVAYTDGTGSIKIVDDSSIIWIDDQDHIADDVPMTR